MKWCFVLDSKEAMSQLLTSSNPIMLLFIVEHCFDFGDVFCSCVCTVAAKIKLKKKNHLRLYY